MSIYYLPFEIVFYPALIVQHHREDFSHFSIYFHFLKCYQTSWFLSYVEKYSIADNLDECLFSILIFVIVNARVKIRVYYVKLH